MKRFMLNKLLVLKILIIQIMFQTIKSTLRSQTVKVFSLIFLPKLSFNSLLKENKSSTTITFIFP